MPFGVKIGSNKKVGVILKPAFDFNGAGFVLDFGSPIQVRQSLIDLSKELPEFFESKSYTVEEVRDIVRAHFADIVKTLKKNRWDYIMGNAMGELAITKFGEDDIFYLVDERKLFKPDGRYFDKVQMKPGVDADIQAYIEKCIIGDVTFYTRVDAGSEIVGTPLGSVGTIAALGPGAFHPRTKLLKTTIPRELYLIDLTLSAQHEHDFFRDVANCIGSSACPFDRALCSWIYDQEAPVALLYILNRFVANVDGIMVMRPAMRDRVHEMYLVADSLSWGWKPFAESKINSEPHLFVDRAIFDAEEGDRENLTYIKDTVKWVQNSCMPSAMIIAMYFLKVKFFRNNIFEFDPYAFEYMSVYKCKAGTLMNIATREQKSNEEQMKKFRNFVAQVEDSLNIMIESIKKKEKTSCTLTRETIDLCLDWMANGNYSVISPKQWKEVLTALFPAKNPTDMETIGIMLQTGFQQLKAFQTLSTQNPRLAKASGTDLESTIFAVLDMKELRLVPEEKSAAYEGIRRYLQKFKKGVAADANDLYDFFGTIFPNIQMSYSFKNDPSPKKVYSSPSLEASLYFCNTNSAEVVDTTSLIRNDFIMFSNRLMVELVRVSDDVKSTINRPLGMSIILQASADFDYPIVYDLVMIMWLVTGSKKVTGDGTYHYAVTFRGKDHWYYYSNSQLRNKMQAIQVSHNNEERLRKIMYPKATHHGILYGYARKYTEHGFAG